MRIDWIEVKNYKSLRETPRIQLGERMTLIVGKNNAGKSAVLEALSLQSPNEPHRSRKTIPRKGNRPPQQSIVNYALVGSGHDVRFMLDGVNQRIIMPAAGQQDQAHWQKSLSSILDAPSVRIHRENAVLRGSYMGVIARDGGARVVFWADGTNGRRWVDNQDQSNTVDLEQLCFAQFQTQNVFRFHAERRVATRSAIQNSSRVAADGSNVPDVLHTLLTKQRPRFAEAVALVKRIMPEVQDLLAFVEGSTCVAGIWHEDATDREDLAFLLDQCGTGVGQIVAMCCALVTADQPMVFLIDEPSSFLHPRATYELLELIRERPEHQYVIATHSPEVIAGVEADRVYRLELREGETQVEEIDHTKLEHQRRVLVDVGAKLSSVFGADKILWVEGRTEEEIFRHLLRKLSPTLLRGVKILEVADTGVFDTKHAKRAHSIYERLAKGGGLLPPAIAILLDREKRKPEDVRRLSQDCPTLSFTSRRMIENYLLDPDAIAAVLSEDLVEAKAAAALDDSGSCSVGAQAVEAWLVENSGRREFDCSFDRAGDAVRWMETVHAGRLLEALFAEVSKQLTWFEKPETSVRLAIWLLANKPSELEPLAEEMRALFR